MLETIAVYLGWICLFISFIPLAIGIVGRQIILIKPYIFVWLYVFFSTFFNLFAAYAYYFLPQDTFTISPFLALNDAIFLMLFFIFSDTKRQIIYVIFSILLILITLYDSLFRDKLGDFEEITALKSPLYIISSLLVLQRIFFNKASKSMLQNPQFFIAFAILLNYLFGLIIVPVGAMWRTTFDTYPYLALILSNINYLIQMCLLSCGFYISRKNILGRKIRSTHPPLTPSNPA